MPAVPSCIIEPIWDQFQMLIPAVTDEHPLGCHRPRIPDRVVFDKLVQVLVPGAAYERISDTTCSATTIRRRRDEWIEAGAFKELEQFCLEGYEKMVGLQLENLAVNGCITKAPCGGEAAGRSPVDRGKQGTKRSLLVEGAGIPLGTVVARPTATTPRCCARRWRRCPGSVSTCRSGSPCTWTPTTTRRAPGGCSPSSAVKPGSRPRACPPRSRTRPGGWWNGRTPGTTAGSRSWPSAPRNVSG